MRTPAPNSCFLHQGPGHLEAHDLSMWALSNLKGRTLASGLCLKPLNEDPPLPPRVLKGCIGGRG